MKQIRHFIAILGSIGALGAIAAFAGAQPVAPNFSFHLSLLAQSSATTGESEWRNATGDTVLFSTINFVTVPSDIYDGSPFTEVDFFTYDSANRPTGETVELPAMDDTNASPTQSPTTTGNWTGQCLVVPAGGYLVARATRVVGQGIVADPNQAVVSLSGTESVPTQSNPGAWSNLVRLTTNGATNFDGNTFGQSFTFVNSSQVDEQVGTITVTNSSNNGVSLVRVIQQRPTAGGFSEVGQAIFTMPSASTQPNSTFTATINWGDEPGDQLLVEAFSNSSNAKCVVSIGGMTAAPASDTSYQNLVLFTSPTTGKTFLVSQFRNMSATEGIAISNVAITSLPGAASPGSAFTYYYLQAIDASGNLVGWSNCQMLASGSGQYAFGNFSGLGLFIPAGGKLLVTANRPWAAGKTGVSISSVTVSGSLIPAVQ